MAKDDETGAAQAKPEKEKAPAAKKGGDKGGQKGAKGKKADAGPAPKYKRETPPRLKLTYDSSVKPTMMKEFNYTSVMEVPRIVKITINMGLGRANQDPKIIDNAVEELKLISGQAPVVCKAKKDIATYKLRKGQKIGVMVTLRRERMWEFLDRLCNIALPRVRDFRGVSPRGFDGRGNYTLGLKDQLLFPEIDYMKVDKARGMNISVITTAKTDQESRKLLQLLGMPFRAS